MIHRHSFLRITPVIVAAKREPALSVLSDSLHAVLGDGSAVLSTFICTPFPFANTMWKTREQTSYSFRRGIGELVETAETVSLYSEK